MHLHASTRFATREMAQSLSILFIFSAMLLSDGALAEPQSQKSNPQTATPTVAQDAPSNEGRTSPSAERVNSTDRPAAPPDAHKINLLIRTTIIAVNQANRTGNYSVLRDLGAPGFQSANTTAQLAENFANQRKANFDLSPILFFNPKLIQKPSIDDAGRLRLTGFFETSPQQVNFDLTFENVGGEWRHFALGIGTQLSAKDLRKK